MKVKSIFAKYKKRSSKSKPGSKKALKIILKMFRSLEMLHPFRDGNGRTNVLILQKALINNGFLPVRLDFYRLDLFFREKDALKMLKKAVKNNKDF